MGKITFFVLLLFLFFACKDDNSGVVSKVAPISDVTYTSINGSVLFRWSNPKIDNLAYVEISYSDKEGNIRRFLTKGGLEEQIAEGIADADPYYFSFKVFNTEGYASESVDIMASALESTVNLFSGRVSLTVAFGGVTVSWENEYSEAFVVEMSYADLNGNNYTDEVVIDAGTVGSEFVQIGADVSGTQSLDVYVIVLDVNNNKSDSKLLKFYKKEAGRLLRHNWKILSFSSEETGSPMLNVLDGNPETLWHSRWSSNKAKYPHWLVLDLGGKKHLEKIGLQQRQGDKQMLNGVEAYGSNVRGAANDDIWTLISDFNVAVSEGSPLQQFDFPDPMACRYFKLVFTTSSGKGDVDGAAFAEVYLFGSDVVE